MKRQEHALTACFAWLCVSLFFIGVTGGEAAQKRPAQRRPAKTSKQASPPKPAFEMAVLQTQVMLDRAGYSPGEIDGKHGSSMEHAVAAYKKAGGTPSTPA